MKWAQKSATATTYLCGVKSIVSIDVRWVAPIATIVLGAIETIVPNRVVYKYRVRFLVGNNAT